MNDNIAIMAAKKDAVELISGANMRELINDRVNGGIVSDPLYTAYLCHFLPDDMQGLFLRLLEKYYFEF